MTLSDESRAAQKLFSGHDMLLSCLGTYGVWAAPVRYSYQCWMRDFSLAIQPLLLDLGLQDAALTHLLNVAYRQKADGQVPILFLDGLKGHLHFLVDKLRRSVQGRKVSFMLTRYVQCYGDVGQLTPGTRDSELHFVIAVGEYLARMGRDGYGADTLTHAAELALQYIEKNLLDKDGLITGADWRDTMEKALARTPLLSNNALLVHAYDLMGLSGSATKLRKTINDLYWSGDDLLDWPGCDRKQPFDPLGASLAVLYDVIDPSRYPDVLKGFASVTTPYGFTIQCRHNPVSPEDAETIERTDGVVVWPFVAGFGILGLRHMAARVTPNGNAGLIAQIHGRTQAEYKKLTAHDGFPEWIDPATGKGWGAPKQLWSACLFVRAHHATHTG